MSLGKYITLLCVICLLSGGCADISPGKLTDIRPVSDQNRVGNAYLFRGFIGIFSTGMNSLGEELNAAGVRTRVYQSDQWADVADTIAMQYRNAPDKEPVVLVGHSYGADNILRIAQRLKDQNVKIDLLITLDPVTPPKVPPNVVQTINLYQNNGAMDALPWLRGIPLESEQPGVAVLNEDIRVDRRDLLENDLNHFNIEKQGKVHAEVIKQILGICITRPEWTARKGNNVPPSANNPVVPVSPGARSENGSIIGQSGFPASKWDGARTAVAQ